MPINFPSQRANDASRPITDPVAFQQLYKQSHLAIFRYIYGLHGGPLEDIEDLTALTYLRAWKSRHHFHGSADKAFGWLLKIARNLVIDDHRHRNRRGTAIDIESQIIPSPNLNPEQQVFQQEQIRILWALLELLSDQQREIIVLRYILGWRVKDIAEHLNTRENNISVSIRRILKRLKSDWPVS